MATGNTEPIEWRCRDRVLAFGPRPRIMGILNVTPDSFSDGGVFYNPADAVRRGLEMVQEGADILDVGGESTRPGAAAVEEQEEIRRVIPVIEALRAQTGILISVDTCKAAVARRALEAGAQIVNDVSAGSHDASMLVAVRESGAGLVLMHMAGIPKTMQQAPRYGDVTDEVLAYLRGRMAACREAGVDDRQVVLDPGIGFGKTPEHNVQLLADVPAFVRMGRPVLIGVSRKSVIGYLTGRPVDQRLAGSLAVAVYVAERGAQLLRVHDVKETCDAMNVVATMRSIHACASDGESTGGMMQTGGGAS